MSAIIRVNGEVPQFSENTVFIILVDIVVTVPKVYDVLEYSYDGSPTLVIGNDPLQK